MYSVIEEGYTGEDDVSTLVQPISVTSNWIYEIVDDYSLLVY
jgi:hypothetical protein